MPMARRRTRHFFDLSWSISSHWIHLPSRCCHRSNRLSLLFSLLLIFRGWLLLCLAVTDGSRMVQRQQLSIAVNINRRSRMLTKAFSCSFRLATYLPRVFFGLSPFVAAAAGVSFAVRVRGGLEGPELFALGMSSRRLSIEDCQGDKVCFRIQAAMFRSSMATHLVFHQLLSLAR